ncbi:MAG: 23S rRNA (guanosine(2251)-2'-O)-methyltransferase RlmB [Bacteroidetes bacterium]|jgi:23S rRNA (guanosine2251-2'-O)-methyltransferase|nr:MAG: 23S rRNA (guanosine(2251)-2'-O)-methyltransferase RlmB [Bacteroidota bacterium]
MKQKQSGDHYVYGNHAVEELLKDDSKVNKIEKIYVDEKKHRQFGALLNLARSKKIAVQYVPAVKLDKLFKNKNHQGIGASVMPVTYHSLEEVLSKGTVNLILFLDRITDVRNFGSIARSAYAMGADALLVPAKDSASINADAVKTSAGALLKIPVCRESNMLNALNILKEKGFHIVACHEKTARLIQEVDFNHPTVIILGSEHNGILKEYLKVCDAEAKIPMSKNFDSLNVSVSAGILLYEILRQRTKNQISL